MLAIEPRTDLLTAEGVERLGTDSTPWMRAQTAASMAVLFVEGALSEREWAYAAGILEILARDVEVQVREALSEHVKHSARLPHSIAHRLAMDVESVALPIIRYSSVLDEADLLAIVRDGSVKKRIAVAQRDDLAGAVSGALVDTRVRWVVGALLANETARIDEASYEKILESFGQDEKTQALIAERPALPATIIARMVLRVSEALRQRLIERFGLPEAMAGDLTARARERALSDSIGRLGASETMESLSKRLHQEDALTPEFLLRALCMGQLRLFIAGMAARAGISIGNADELIRDGGQRGLMSIYLHAGLPGDLMPAFRIALNVVREITAAGPVAWSEAHSQRIIAQLVSAYHDLAPGHLESVLAQLARRRRSSPASSPRSSAPSATASPA